ncbi:Splicing factor U2AF-associated protein 2 [Zancudomyces culisetae]|uniref:Splicing factor U2AF-associated protein 2 n=1 Tax=Zancudomyces culisetae TaxID=1213189 RepID=A0A1R1PS00_ZANCU|nr:Splicing factor U2AF-associated protein 2 [Zancudomyces culisetae]|eukprot:OMH83760.1 Splicing factor U2AF-associated protein 2 [Zancudomyces culisetae]
MEKATFKEKPHGDNNLVKKSKVDPSLVKKRFQQLEKKHDWEDEISVVSEKYQRIVVLKGMFTQQEIKDDVTLLIDLKEDIREECEKVGEVTSIKILELLNGRFFAGRQIEATISTGKVKTKHDIPADNVTGTQDEGDPRSSKPTVKPSKEGEEAARLADYAKWLEG